MPPPEKPLLPGLDLSPPPPISPAKCRGTCGAQIPSSSQTEALWALKVYTDNSLKPSRPYKSESLTILMSCTPQCSISQRPCFLHADTLEDVDAAQRRTGGGRRAVEQGS